MSEKEQVPTKQLTLRLPLDTHRKLKILSACTGKSMKTLLVECINDKLQECLEQELSDHPLRR
ncbi:hypothetical protein Dret_2274 [Desulfohalobium retbaense DSM 5692]|uniref:Uncharacterized protein n=1 Tax=Desulfohalobium retbaense (strain ATCC 49708 / DSM 5692 / JCM 16813 / HR100) TaxID=485915 RepID=C8X561_DESRD|nr:hypothetical protein Dret_2274 [Desulfohalobium retbaense DSM 5692]